MEKPKVIIPTGLGINSHEELSTIFRYAGASTEYVHINDLIKAPEITDYFDGMGDAGGFTMGDELGAGQSLANRIRKSGLREKIAEKLNDPNFPIYSVCNFLQVFAKLDLFPIKVGTLKNDSGKHETGSWDVKVNKNNDTVWLKYLKDYNAPIFSPISNGEGRIIVPDNELKKLEIDNLVALTYVKGYICDYFKSSRGERYNPNGSVKDIAGFGWKNNLVLFNHFERLIKNFQREDKANIKSGKVKPKIYESTPDGLYEPTYLMFKAAVDFMKENKNK